MSESLDLALPTKSEIKEEVEKKTAVSQEDKTALQTVADERAVAYMNIDFDNMSVRSEAVSNIEQFGKEAMVASERTNNMLSKRLITFENRGGEGNEVAKGIADLQVQMKNLDPTGINFSEGVKQKIMNPVRRYFAKYQKADTAIKDIVTSIEHGKKTLEADNKTLLLEQGSLIDQTVKLKKYIEMGQSMDNAFVQQIENARLNGVDEDKIKFVETEILFPLRQRIMDMGTLAVVNYQGIGAIDLIRANNRELIRGAERAQMVTVSALRTAAMAAMALTNQKMVLNAINALNQTTSDMITATANMLNTQGTEIQELSANPMIAVDKLKEAMALTFDAMDNFENFRQRSLPVMAETVKTFSEIGAEGADRLARIEAAKAYRGELEETED